MAIAPLVVTLAGVDSYSNLYYWLFFVFPPYRFGEFLLGMVLARAMICGLRTPAPARTALAATAGVAGLTWAMTAFTVRTGIPVMRPFVGLLAISFFALLLCASATRDTQPGGWWLGSAPLRALGDWSFALYLVHAPAMVFTAHYGLWNNSGGRWGLAYLLAFLTLVLAVSATLHYLVERPVERRLRRLPVGQPPRPPGLAQPRPSPRRPVSLSSPGWKRSAQPRS
jgi:peptidoglycan/LPS O-acetylase OafA/YrhL